MAVRVYTYDLTLDEDESPEDGQDRIDKALADAAIFTDFELVSVVTEGEDEEEGQDATE